MHDYSIWLIAFFLFAFSVVIPYHHYQNRDSLKCFTLDHFVQPCIIQYCSEFYMSACFQNFTGIYIKCSVSSGRSR